MFDYLIPIIAGCAVFLLFMLVFIRRDARGNRGGRLAGCAHHDAGAGCDRCRDHQPIIIRSHPSDQKTVSAGNTWQDPVNINENRSNKTE